MKFIMLINVKIPAIVGVLTFISMINTTSVSSKMFSVLDIIEMLKFHAHLSRKSYITSAQADLSLC